VFGNAKRCPVFSPTKVFVFCLLALIFFIQACSVPNLENPVCADSGRVIKEFYSFHFGGDMKPSAENLQSRERFLTEDLKRKLSSEQSGAKDYFTATDDYPKAFRVGGCTVENENKTVFQVVFFWRDDTRNEQREIKVETIKQNDAWLINKIFDTSK
jgi:hypothetical protein